MAESGIWFRTEQDSWMYVYVCVWVATGWQFRTGLDSRACMYAFIMHACVYVWWIFPAPHFDICGCLLVHANPCLYARKHIFKPEKQGPCRSEKLVLGDAQLYTIDAYLFSNALLLLRSYWCPKLPMSFRLSKEIIRMTMKAESPRFAALWAYRHAVNLQLVVFECQYGSDTATNKQPGLLLCEHTYRAHSHGVNFQLNVSVIFKMSWWFIQSRA